MKLRTTFLWTLIVSLSIAAILGIIAILMPDLIGADEEILVTSVLLGLYSLPPLACAIVLGKRRFVPFMWIGIVSSFVAWLIWLPLIWGDPWRWDTDWEVEMLLAKSGFTLTILAGWSTHLGLLALLRLDFAWPRRVRLGTLSAAGLVSAVGIVTMWFEIEEEWLFRGIAVLLILLGSGTLLTPVVALLESLRRRNTRESIASDIKVDVVCPRCGSNERIPAGAGRCEACGLRIEINVEEPRCPCGYLLFRLEGDRCPECGRVARCACGCVIDNARGVCPKCGAVMPRE